VLSLALLIADVGGCSLAAAVPVVSAALPVVTGPEPASRLAAVLQGPAMAMVELTASMAPTSIDFLSMTISILTCRLMLGGAGVRHFAMMLLREHLCLIAQGIGRS
jgi:hypothetical protein